MGLGNIGPQYVGTRHNIGFEVVSLVARELQAESEQARQHYGWARAKLPNGPEASDLILALPTTLMNRSGLAVRDLVDELDFDPGQLLVVVDDFNLPLGTLRFRKSGSDGGHNGLASIIEHLETEDFPRLRVGIGAPDDNIEKVSFVLSRFEPKESETVKRLVATAAKAVIFAATHSFEEVMGKLNRNPALPE
jgi:PTH1 family peptidyl-tRNA hydrolase